MNSQLDRAIKLAANTGDKIIVVDELNDRSSVVMSLDDYEKLLNGQNKTNKREENLTDEDLFDKLNRDTDSENSFEDEEEEDSTFASPGEALADKDEIFPDFTALNLAADDNLTPETEEETEIKEEPAAAAVDDNENLYYYNEPEKTETETAHEETGFTSIKDELKKSRKAWEIPAEVKEAAEDVVF